MKTINKNGESKITWTFPRDTLEDALKIPKALEEQNAGNPMKADILSKAVGFNQPDDWRFKHLLRSANQYGLVDGSGIKAIVTMTPTGNDVIAPGSPDQRQNALLQAFRNVEDFRKVEDFYKNKKLPESEFFENTLVREFSISRDRVGTFMEIFTKNLNYLRAFRVNQDFVENVNVNNEENTEVKSIKKGLAYEVDANNETKIRKYLDTCFVMMPFGEWQDVYYKDVFSIAIQDAGLEPVRADELFTTGSVIEQIWEQIEKSKILIADLTGKNANVFYELGLAHAAQKPVVFISEKEEDIPFDLRHLRVILYNTKDPFWGDKLKKNLTEYLKNASKDPNKSIPQPFRLVDEK